jgi:uncharacterized lipoprotein YmbA
MMNRFRIFFVLTLILVTGCSSLLLPKSPPPVYYRLEYKSVGVECARSFTEGLRVWDFITSSPFNQSDMVVIDHGQQVSFSGSYQWITSLFSQVVSGDSPIDVPLALSGHVFTFAWMRQGSTARAKLQVEVSLSATGAKNRLIFRRTYELKSVPFTEDTAAAFARAMSGIVSQFSQQLQRDLCLLGDVVK